MEDQQSLTRFPHQNELAVQLVEKTNELLRLSEFKIERSELAISLGNRLLELQQELLRAQECHAELLSQHGDLMDSINRSQPANQPNIGSSVPSLALLEQRQDRLARVDASYERIGSASSLQIRIRTEVEDLGHMRSSTWQRVREASDGIFKLSEQCNDLILMLVLMSKPPVDS